jgi:hypothetical protein
VHQPAKGGIDTQAVAPGVRAIDWPSFFKRL